MFVFLPARGLEFEAFKKQFNLENWQRWMSRFRTAKVDLSMPKYKIEFATELKSALSKMGMAEAFGTRSDFSNMTANPSSISKVLQKTYMDVNEEGTEAAAVTAVVMTSRAMHFEQPPIEFTVDRPFVVALMDRDTHEILFLGSIVEP